MRPFNLGSVCSTELLDATRQHAAEVAALEAQIADLKQLVALLQSQLADIRDQKDKWQSGAERISLISM
jgi:predicted  nucleic acid-binding Zn-ribbon protein